MLIVFERYCQGFIGIDESQKIWVKRRIISYKKGVFKINSADFPGGPVAKTLHSQCSGAQVPSPVRELDPTGLPHAATTSSYAATKDPACHK